MTQWSCPIACFRIKANAQSKTKMRCESTIWAPFNTCQTIAKWKEKPIKKKVCAYIGTNQTCAYEASPQCRRYYYTHILQRSRERMHIAI